MQNGFWIFSEIQNVQIPPEITVSNDMLNQRTVVELLASDRPGLLADIGRCFRRLQLTLQNARIATLGEHVEDVFFLVDANGEPLHSSADVERLQYELTETILEVMDRWIPIYNVCNPIHSKN